jgi:hypothetical protein
MADWTVKSSDEVFAQRAQIGAGYLSRIDAILQKTSSEKPGSVAKSFKKFRLFLKKVDDLQNGIRKPQDFLVFVRNDADGVPLYSLIHDKWRCLYRVEGGICTSAKIERMTPDLRRAEESRHKHGQKLPNL